VLAELELGSGYAACLPAKCSLNLNLNLNLSWSADMILTHSVKVCLATQPCDLRKSFEGLSAVVRVQIKEDPQSRTDFVFLVIDADEIYDPRLLNDRLLLGLKGTMSKFKLGILRQRAQEACRQKVLRGEVLTKVLIGCIRPPRTPTISNCCASSKTPPMLVHSPGGGLPHAPRSLMDDHGRPTVTSSTSTAISRNSRAID
jgi:hypothetical protein